MRPNDDVILIFHTRARETVEIQLTHEGTVVGVFEVLREEYLCKQCLIVYVEGFAIGGE